MLALVRFDRQAGALEAYQSARQVLVEELGADPGAELRELHQRILTADPALAAPAGDRPAVVVPRELPSPVAGFVGRARELAALSGLLDRSAGRAPAAVVLSAIGGTAGVGTTALAIQWAQRAARYRSLLAGRRVLIVLDNAGSGPACQFQVQPAHRLPWIDGW